MLQLTVHTGSIKVILVNLKYVGNKREHKNEIDLHYILSELIITKIGKPFKDTFTNNAKRYSSHSHSHDLAPFKVILVVFCQYTQASY